MGLHEFLKYSFSCQHWKTVTLSFASSLNPKRIGVASWRLAGLTDQAEGLGTLPGRAGPAAGLGGVRSQPLRCPRPAAAGRPVCFLPCFPLPAAQHSGAPASPYSFCFQSRSLHFCTLSPAGSAHGVDPAPCVSSRPVSSRARAARSPGRTPGRPLLRAHNRQTPGGSPGRTRWPKRTYGLQGGVLPRQPPCARREDVQVSLSLLSHFPPLGTLIARHPPSQRTHGAHAHAHTQSTQSMHTHARSTRVRKARKACAHTHTECARAQSMHAEHAKHARKARTERTSPEIQHPLVFCNGLKNVPGGPSADAPLSLCTAIGLDLDPQHHPGHGRGLGRSCGSAQPGDRRSRGP